MNPRRDIFVMCRQQNMSEEQLEHEVSILNKLLCDAELINHFVQVHEVFDLNRNRVIRDSRKMKKMISRKKTERPFVFLANMN